MAEQIQNTDYSKYDKFLVNEEKQPSDIVITPPTDKNLDLNKYNKFIISDDKPETTNKYDKFIISDKVDTDLSIAEKSKDEPSFFRKFLYGFDKQDQFFGNVYRIGKAKLQDIADDEKNFKEIVLENEASQQGALYRRFQKFTGGKYDNDLATQAGEMAAFLLDPFYLLAYMTPWGRAATTTYKGLAMLGGGTIGLDKLVSDYANYGEVRPKDAAIAAGTGAVFGPAAVKAFRVISKYFPTADAKKIEQIVGLAEGQTAKKLGIKKQDLKKLQDIVSDKELITVNNLIKKAGENYSKPFKELQFNYDKNVLTLQKKVDKLIKINKDKKTKANTKTISKLENDITSIQKQFKKDRKSLVIKQADKQKKVTDLIAQREVKLIENLRKSENVFDAGVRYLLSATVRPLAGAGIGAAFGTLWGDSDEDLNKWIIGGATLGAIQKGIQASKVLQVGEKKTVSNIINNEAVKLTLQKLRALTATTTSSKLKAYGGETEKIANLLLEGIDSPLTKFSVSKNADAIQRNWTNRAVETVKGFTNIESKNAIDSLRGAKNKLTTREKVVKGRIQRYLDDFKSLYNDAGIFSKQNVENYFPRVYDFAKINRNPDEFKKVLTEIFKLKKAKDPTKEANKFFNKINDISEFNLIKTNIDDLINDKKLSQNYILTPLSNHITKQRILTGPYKQVEKLLTDGGFLIDEPAQILASLVNRSAKSIAFAERFGPHGEFLVPYIQGIKTKYKNTGKSNWRELAKKEIKLVEDTIEAYFDRFGQARRNQLKNTAGVLATMSNLNMLDRVTIASLGDLVQPFTNSTNWTTWIRALAQTGGTAKSEKGVAKNLYQAVTNETQVALQKPLAIKGDEITAMSKWMGNDKLSMRAANNLFFRVSGLEWLTGFARRFAYNAGANDAFISAKKLANYVNKGNKINSSKGVKLVADLDRYGITATDGLKLGVNKNFNDAAKTKLGKQLLNDAGIQASNRDAIIPQVSNRLLFTQSQTPWIRLMGQFLSWAMAKSAQTNKILQRIENGDTRTMVKLLASIPVYGGIQELRELAKYGEVVTDIDSDTDTWWAESLRLSGISGVLPEFLASTFVGPGSRQPFFLAFPAGSMIYELDKIKSDVIKGDTDKAWQRTLDRIAPLPNWRKIIQNIGQDLDLINVPKSLLPVPKGSDRIKLNEGDVVIPLKKPEDKNMNKKDLAALATASLIASVAPVNEVHDKDIVPLQKPKKEIIIPEKKPDVETQIKKITKKNYDNVSALEPNKKSWLLNTSEKVYKTNKVYPEINDIIIAINSEETGWGTSRFVKDGSNNLFNIQVFDKNEPHIKAKGSNAMIKKYPTEEDSIKDFLNMVSNSEKYQGVRDTITAFNNGEASKADIIKSIADTGYAENKKWSSNVTGILNRRIDGKNREELKSVYNNLFVDKE
tara:strand:- start:238 stop:4473 length:4236 start_codon:yes stop_codon:yes gene_type:complete